MKRKQLLVVAIAVLLLAACGATPEASLPASSGPTAAPAQATATQSSSAPVGAASGGDLTGAEMSAILQNSFTAYPWQLQFTSTNVTTSETVSGTVKAQSPDRVETVIEQPIQSSPAVADIIVISPTLYVKVTGVPALALETIGLQPGQWAKIAPGQDSLNLTGLALAAANPSQLLGDMGYQGLLSVPNPSEQVFTLTGTEDVNGVQANVYEYQSGSGTGSTTFQVAVGVDDGRVYRVQSEGPQQTSSTTVTYDSSLSIEAPIP